MGNKIFMNSLKSCSKRSDTFYHYIWITFDFAGLLQRRQLYSLPEPDILGIKDRLFLYVSLGLMISECLNTIREKTVKQPGKYISVFGKSL